MIAKKILVTGATGFIGRHALTPLLKRKYEVHAVSLHDHNQPLTGMVRWYQANLLDLKQISALLDTVQPTHLLHFAWDVTLGQYWNSPNNLDWVQASLHLLKLFAAHGGQRVVMAGSCVEYDWSHGQYCVENVTPHAFQTLYGASKHALQLILHQFAKASTLSAAWGRIFYLYGPGEQAKRLVPSVICSLLHEEVARCTHGNQIRDFLYVQDVADAFVALLDSEICGPVNIGSGYPVQLKTLINLISEKLGKIHLVQLGALPAPQNEPPLLVADTTRLQQEVGWLPQYSLDEGLDKTIQWWKEELGQ